VSTRDQSYISKVTETWTENSHNCVCVFVAIVRNGGRFSEIIQAMYASHLLLSVWMVNWLC